MDASVVDQIIEEIESKEEKCKDQRQLIKMNSQNSLRYLRSRFASLCRLALSIETTKDLMEHFIDYGINENHANKLLVFLKSEGHWRNAQRQTKRKKIITQL